MSTNPSIADLAVPLQSIYGSDRRIISEQEIRYKKLSENFEEIFGTRPEKFFSSPGRTEICGNHTDHNHGKVIAASINLDSIAAVSANDKDVVLYTAQYEEPFIVNLNNTKPVEEERSSTTALIRGVADGFKNYGYKIGGFNAYISSDVLIGSGLSSSASIEVLIGTIFNHLYNNGKVSGEEIAIIGQYAENKFFGKPCGLMDQLACAIGGIIEIDFYNPQKPIIKKLEFDFSSTGYKLIIVDTEDNHADLTEEYAAIPEEMKQVANYYHKEFCSELSFDEIIQKMKSLRGKVSDRAILRAIHFFQENIRVDKQIDALNRNDFNEFLRLVNESGDSSYKYLQNIYSPQNIEKQNVSLALAMTDVFIKEKGKGACRVHGGGFAGTIQVFVPVKLVEEYKSYMSKLVNEKSVNVLSIRDKGVLLLNNF
ncbi:MAG: galactokinase family protein [Ignavibacteriaceae bacterium]